MTYSGLGPRLRPIEIIPFQSDGRALLCLRDRDDPDSQQLVLSGAAHLLLALMDGSRDLTTLCQDFQRYAGATVQEEDVANLIQTLDDAYLLENRRSQAHQESLRRAFDVLPMRPPAFAGGAYPGEPASLRAFLAEQSRAPDGPNGSHRISRSTQHISAAVIPHVDLHRGGPTYAWAYGALEASQQASTYIILGTCHAPMTQPFSLLSKPYDTPLGPAPIDQEIASILIDTLGTNLTADAYAHRGEHSIEFQALYLRAIERVGASCGGTIIPILCQATQAYTRPGQLPEGTQPGADFIGAVREAIQNTGRSVCIVAGADLAHVGPQFGDPQTLTTEDMALVRLRDLEMLEHVVRGEGNAFYQQVMEDNDKRRICGLSPIYYTLRIQEPSHGDVLRYTQWLEPNGHSAVTFASVVFPG